jgi:hypothetical protein
MAKDLTTNWVWDLYSRASTNKPWVYTSSQSSRRVLRSETGTPTEYRKRPTDLFLNGTYRSRSTTIVRQTGLTYGNSTSMTVGRPMEDIFWFKNNFPASTVSRAAMYNQIRNEMRSQAVNLGNMCAEYRQTAQLFLDAANFIRTRGMSLGRSVQRKKGKTKAFLGFQYGLRPFASDLGDLVNTMYNGLHTPLYMTGYKHRKDAARNVLNTTSASNTDWKSLTVLEHKTILRTRWRARLSTNQIQNSLIRQGMLNLPAIAWEVVPYSFVVDWWINVGDVLQSLDNLLLCDELLVIDSSSISTCESWSTNGYNLGSSFGSSGSMMKIVRSDIRNPPTAISRINTLLYKPSVSVEHIANGLALLHAAKVGR